MGIFNIPPPDPTPINEPLPNAISLAAYLAEFEDGTSAVVTTFYTKEDTAFISGYVIKNEQHLAGIKNPYKGNVYLYVHAHEISVREWMECPVLNYPVNKIQMNPDWVWGYNPT